MLEDKIESLWKTGKISQTIYENLKTWLSLGRDRKEIEYLLEHDLEELKDSFSQVIPFGTGGRRGKMGIGPNRINIYTMMESAQGVADYAHSLGIANFSVVIAYDTRNGSESFAEKVASVFLGNGAKVYLFSSFRSTPELSFAVRYLKATVGIMISASHNPPADNGIKVYWSDGAQVVSPHDVGIIEKVKEHNPIREMDLKEGLEKGLLEYVGFEVDSKYLELLQSISIYPQREFPIVFSPLHGVGNTNGFEGLSRKGFSPLYRVEKQCLPRGDFPYVKQNSPNPENPSAMEEALQLGSLKKAKLALVTDPDADRLGVGVFHQGEWRLLTGNQIGIIILYHLIQSMKAKNSLPKNGVVMKTLPTSSLISKIAKKAGLHVVDNLLVGFKYIGYFIENLPPSQTFLFGTEESHGYLLSPEVRDKDGAMAALAMAEIGAYLDRQGKTILDSLEEIYQTFGYHYNEVRSITMPGLAGRERIQEIMSYLREKRPSRIGNMQVKRILDYQEGKEFLEGIEKEFSHPFQGNLLYFELLFPQKPWEGFFVLRPSGTEPKIKLYLEISSPPQKRPIKEQEEEAKQLASQEMSQILKDIGLEKE
ncbi:MAG: phospho-sugar mutase [Planctomycetota bacterium]|nr:MAG: phospho-sugar mutase [Planctomycetota bacterium]